MHWLWAHFNSERERERERERETYKSIKMHTHRRRRRRKKSAEEKKRQQHFSSGFQQCIAECRLPCRIALAADVDGLDGAASFQLLQYIRWLKQFCHTSSVGFQAADVVDV
jgi:hypothetical protein